MTPTGSSVFYRKHKRNKPTVAHGEGIYLFDTDGKRYIDASGGAVVVNVGHGVQEIADAIRDQAAQVAYAHATMFTSGPVEDLSARLSEVLPISDARIFYMASGSEATETAMKLARQIQMARGQAGRYKVIARWGAYHGATMGALGISGKPSMKAPFDLMFVDMPHIPPVYCYRCPFGLSYPDCALRCADELENAILAEGPDTVAAFIGEPVAGATLGAAVPPDDYWARIREICDKYDVLLIADEVMTGMGRTGAWSSIGDFGVQPDILCLGKGLSGGYLPLSAVAARGDVVDLLWEKIGDFNHGGTFSHQPVAAAAGVAALDYLQTHDLIARSKSLGEKLGEKLHAAFDDHPYVGDVRGRGLMWAIEFVEDRATQTAFSSELHLAEQIYLEAFENGLIVYPMSGSVDGIAGDHVMVSPPLTVNEHELDAIVQLLQASVERVLTNL